MRRQRPTPSSAGACWTTATAPTSSVARCPGDLQGGPSAWAARCSAAASRPWCTWPCCAGSRASPPRPSDSAAAPDLARGARPSPGAHVHRRGPLPRPSPRPWWAWRAPSWWRAATTSGTCGAATARTTSGATAIRPARPFLRNLLGRDRGVQQRRRGRLPARLRRPRWTCPCPRGRRRGRAPHLAPRRPPTRCASLGPTAANKATKATPPSPGPSRSCPSTAGLGSRSRRCPPRPRRRLGTASAPLTPIVASPGRLPVRLHPLVRLYVTSSPSATSGGEEVQGSPFTADDGATEARTSYATGDGLVGGGGRAAELLGGARRQLEQAVFTSASVAAELQRVEVVAPLRLGLAGPLVPRLRRRRRARLGP